MKKIIKAYKEQIKKDGTLKKAYKRLKKDFPDLISKKSKKTIKKFLK